MRSVLLCCLLLFVSQSSLAEPRDLDPRICEPKRSREELERDIRTFKNNIQILQNNIIIYQRTIERLSGPNIRLTNDQHIRSSYYNIERANIDIADNKQKLVEWENELGNFENKRQQCLKDLEAKRQQRVERASSASLGELEQIPSFERLPEENQAIEAHKRRLEARRTQTEQHLRDPKWSQPALSAMICAAEADIAKLKKQVREASLTVKVGGQDDYGYSDLQDYVQQRAEEIQSCKKRLKFTKMQPLPCKGEVQKIAACVVGRWEAQRGRRGPQTIRVGDLDRDIPSNCQDERMTAFLDMME